MYLNSLGGYELDTFLKELFGFPCRGYVCLYLRFKDTVLF